MLRSLTGQMVGFAVDYEVPGEDGRAFEHVHLDLELTPGFPRAGRLPLQGSLPLVSPAVWGRSWPAAAIRASCVRERSGRRRCGPQVVAAPGCGCE
jgi:hypothetical protein